MNALLNTISTPFARGLSFLKNQMNSTPLTVVDVVGMNR